MKKEMDTKYQKTEKRRQRTEYGQNAIRGGDRTRPITVYLLSSIFFFLFSVFCFQSSVTAIAEEMTATDVDTTRAALEKWVETRRIISREKQDFVLGKEMLNERIDLLENEIKALQAKIKETEASISEADKKREELVQENDKFKGATSLLEGIVTVLEKRTKSLLKQLPDPIVEKVKPLSQRFPDGTSETKLALSERFQNIVGVLNEINKFNREITATSEVRKLPDGTSAEVTAFYIGIGQGYYANSKGDIAGVGASTSNGWEWTPANESAAQISQAIAILKNELPARYVQVPINVQ